MCQHGDDKVTEQNLKKNFSNVYDLFAIGLAITNLTFIRGDKTKRILLGPKKRVTKESNLDVKYVTVHIEQYHTVWYLGRVLDENLSGKPMSNTWLRFLYLINVFLSQNLRRLIFNAIIQLLFESVFWRNINKSLKSTLQILQNKYIRFCLTLNNRVYIELNKFDK